MKTKEIKRYKKNPFIENMIIPISQKQVKLSILGKDEDILINENTGEIKGTHLITYKQVDGENFVKLFTQNIALTFDLNSSGIKAFNVLLFTIQNTAITKDQVDLDTFTLDMFLTSNKDKKLNLSLATFKRGLRQLEESQIIARTLRRGRFFINPNFCFNGNRIAFTTLIEKNEKIK
jgi:hypothetical protein